MAAAYVEAYSSRCVRSRYRADAARGELRQSAVCAGLLSDVGEVGGLFRGWYQRGALNTPWGPNYPFQRVNPLTSYLPKWPNSAILGVRGGV